MCARARVHALRMCVYIFVITVTLGLVIWTKRINANFRIRIHCLYISFRAVRSYIAKFEFAA